MGVDLELQWLNPHDAGQAFPDPNHSLREPNGLLALGGDLSVPRLLQAYDHGIFPWYGPGEPILWWSPDPRTVFLPGGMHVSRSLRRHLRRGDFAVSLDRDFPSVIRACAAPRADQNGTWLGANMRRAYCRLHQLGHAHSVEVWRRGQLVGGLYGVARGRVFFGESMFSAVPNASKVALICLAEQLWEWEFALFDAQVSSPHLYRMGAVDLPRARFQARLREAVAGADSRCLWAFDKTPSGNPTHLPGEPP